MTTPSCIRLAMVTIGLTAAVIAQAGSGQASTSPALTSLAAQVGYIAPQATKTVNPTYPLDLRVAGVQGTAVVEIWIDEKGRVERAVLIESTRPEFGAKALAAARAWSFIPASFQGNPVDSKVQVPFHFVMPQLARR